MTDGFKREKKNKIKESHKKGWCVLNEKGMKYAAKEKPIFSFQSVLLSSLLKCICICLKHSGGGQTLSYLRLQELALVRTVIQIPKKKKKNEVLNMGACQISQLELDKYKKDYKEPERIWRGHNSSGTFRLWELDCKFESGQSACPSENSKHRTLPQAQASFSSCER